MNDSLSRLCDLFIENRDRIKSTFIWQNSYIYPVCAMIFADKKQLVDIGQLRTCDDLLKQYTGLFSNFRGTAKLAMVAMLAVSPDPEKRMKLSVEMYDQLKACFFTSAYLPVAAVILADLVSLDRFMPVAQRTRRIYDLMKREHPFLTSAEDSVFAALLALSELDDAQIIRETERCYQLLKEAFFSRNAVQSLSHVLALCPGGPEEKVEKTMRLYHELRVNGCKYGGDYELANLGVLAVLPPKNVVQDIVEVDSFLATQKGYGLLGLGRKQRLMHAGMLVASDALANIDQQEKTRQSSENLTMQTAAISSTISLIVAQQAAVCAAVAASSAAAASSNT